MVVWGCGEIHLFHSIQCFSLLPYLRSYWLLRYAFCIVCCRLWDALRVILQVTADYTISYFYFDWLFTGVRPTIDDESLLCCVAFCVDRASKSGGLLWLWSSWPMSVKNTMRGQPSRSPTESNHEPVDTPKLCCKEAVHLASQGCWPRTRDSPI